MSNIVSRGLSAVRNIISWGGKERAQLEAHDLDRIRESRETGTVLPLRDSATTAEVTRTLEVVPL